MAWFNSDKEFPLGQLPAPFQNGTTSVNVSFYVTSVALFWLCSLEIFRVEGRHDSGSSLKDKSRSKIWRGACFSFPGTLALTLRLWWFYTMEWRTEKWDSKMVKLGIFTQEWSPEKACSQYSTESPSMLGCSSPSWHVFELRFSPGVPSAIPQLAW